MTYRIHYEYVNHVTVILIRRNTGLYVLMPMSLLKLVLILIISNSNFYKGYSSLFPQMFEK